MRVASSPVVAMRVTRVDRTLGIVRRSMGRPMVAACARLVAAYCSWRLAGRSVVVGIPVRCVADGPCRPKHRGSHVFAHLPVGLSLVAEKTFSPPLILSL